AELHEVGAVVYERGDALARGELAALVLALDPFRPAAEPEALGAALQLVQERAVVGGAGAEGVGVGGVGSEGGTVSCFGHAGRGIRGIGAAENIPGAAQKKGPAPPQGPGPGARSA